MLDFAGLRLRSPVEICLEICRHIFGGEIFNSNLNMPVVERLRGGKLLDERSSTRRF